MGETKSTTKDVSGFTDAVIGTKTYETTISNGKESVSNKGNSSQDSQSKASESWKNR